MSSFRRIVLAFLVLLTVGLLAFKLGKQKAVVEYVYPENKDVFRCPYTVRDNMYAEYATLGSEMVVIGKPELIENPEVVKINEPFNFSEFEKGLYKLSTNKGWGEKKFDVDDDGEEERIISANVAMNHQPHIALILKDNRVVFRAEGANIWIEANNLGRGFTLHKTIDWIIGESEMVRYLPKEGGFIPVWKQKSCWVRFE